MTGGLRFHVVLCHGPRPTGVSAEGGRRPIGWPRRPAALPVDLVPRCGAPRSWLPPIGGAQPPLPHDAARLRAAMAVPLPPLSSPSPPPPPPAEVCVVSIARFGTRGRGRVLPRRFFGWPGRPRPPIPPRSPPAPPTSSSSRLCPPSPHALAAARSRATGACCVLESTLPWPPPSVQPPRPCPTRCSWWRGWLTRCVRLRPPSPPTPATTRPTGVARGSIPWR